MKAIQLNVLHFQRSSAYFNNVKFIQIIEPNPDPCFDAAGICYYLSQTGDSLIRIESTRLTAENPISRSREFDIEPDAVLIASIPKIMTIPDICPITRSRLLEVPSGD
ncbi:MAG: hypothetical protein ACYSR9_01645, partial [Planctomycetota bacterium]